MSFFSRKPKQEEHLKEASTNFDRENVVPFLRRIQPFIDSGFGDPQIAQIDSSISNMNLDDEKELVFSVLYSDKPSTLKIRVFMDDIDSPDLYFFATTDLAAKITMEIRAFCEELGI